MYQVFLSVLVLFWYGNEGFLMIYHLFPPFLSPLFYRGKKKHKNKRNQPDFSFFLLPFLFLSSPILYLSVQKKKVRKSYIFLLPLFSSSPHCNWGVWLKQGWGGARGRRKNIFVLFFTFSNLLLFLLFSGKMKLFCPLPSSKCFRSPSSSSSSSQ